VCVSCYTAALAAAGLWAAGHVRGVDTPIVWLGLAGASVVIDRYWKR